MTSYPTIEAALDAMPPPVQIESPIQRFELPHGVPEVWLANLHDTVNFYGKQCCPTIQNFSGPGLIVIYEWESIFDNGIGSAATPFFEPNYVDDGIVPAALTEHPTVGGFDPPVDCHGARVVEGEFRGGPTWPTQYTVTPGSPGSEHNWGGWWAINMTQCCGSSKTINRLDAPPTTGLFITEKYWSMVIMGMGLYMGDVYKNCSGEPRPRQIRPFFSLYVFPSHQRC